MLTIQQLRQWAHDLDTLAVQAALNLPAELADAAQVAELVDRVHAPIYAGVAMIASSINAQIGRVQAGTETPMQAITAVIPDALKVWEDSKTIPHTT
jgi:hypothetical protein